MNGRNSRRNTIVSGDEAIRPTRKRITMALAGAVSLIAISAHAQDAQQVQATTPAPAAEPAKPPATWAEGITTSFWIEGGSTFNSVQKPGDRNFGRLFDDKTDSFQLNQMTFTVQRKIDSSLPTYDLGFKLQGMYGSDARYTHFLREFQYTTGDSINEFDLVEANVQLHTPWFTDGGFDIKVGQYPTLEGLETIDPTTNYLYSHSYIFNFGIPLKHTGFISVLHATPVVDLYAGVDTGVNTDFGSGDNNNSAAFHGGIGLNLMGGNLTVLATTHIGPENATAASNGVTLPKGADSKDRYLNDVATTWKFNDKLTFLNELNYIQDDCQAIGAAGASKCGTARGYGVAQYAVYQFDDVFTFVGRGEVWRDEEGAFVTQFDNNQDFVRAEEGAPLKGLTFSGGRTTYLGLTAGVNIKPAMTIPLVSSLVIRPEVRYDTSLNNTKPFGDNTKGSQVTVASDFILQF